MRRFCLAATISFFTILIFSATFSAQREETFSFAPIRGFAPAHAAAEHRLEAEFQAIPSPAKAREWHRTLTAEPHPAASERNNQLADFIAEEWRKQGMEDVTLRRYDVLHSRPRSVSFEITAPVHYTASLREDPYEVDPDTKSPATSGAYFGYSASGEVTAEVVYAHRGNPEDYDLLRRSGITVRGKIVLVRYSNPYSYRGFKALTAEREGATALLIYSDPAEDGYARGKVSRWAVGTGEPHSARRDYLRLHCAGGSHNAGLGFRSRREAHHAGRSTLAPENYWPSSFLARRETAAGKHEWAGSAQGVARSAAPQVPADGRGDGARESGHGYEPAALHGGGGADSGKRMAG